MRCFFFIASLFADRRFASPAYDDAAASEYLRRLPRTLADELCAISAAVTRDFFRSARKSSRRVLLSIVIGRESRRDASGFVPAPFGTASRGGG